MGRRVLSIIMALVVALLGVVGVVAYASAADKRAVAGQETSLVYISKGQVPVGTTAREAVAQRLIEQESVVRKGVPVGALALVDGTNDTLVATSVIMPGEIVLASRFGHPAAQDTTSTIPDGKVAVTVSLPDPQRIAPLLEPGAHIVVFDTFNARDPKAKLLLPDGRHLTDEQPIVKVTRVLLPDVEVIGVGDATTTAIPTPTPSTTTDTKAKTPLADPNAAVLITVAVTPGQATSLVHGIQTGALYAALRGTGAKVDPHANVNDNTVFAR
jgi:pilus assembly protein CpaB